MNEKIDFVILWVDGGDPKWLKEKNKYSPKKIDVTNDDRRYRDYGILKYWFRSVEKFTPWVNKIHFVTWGHIPEWLDTSNPKLNIVNHKDFIPMEYLPVFNSTAIELNIHRIKGLSEKFVYFNDDTLILRNLDSTFFFKNGFPTDAWIEDIMILDKDTDLNHAYILTNVSKILNTHFLKRECIKKNFFKWFNFKYGKGLIKNVLLYSWKNIPSFHNFHTSNSYLKSTFEEIWEKESDVLIETSKSKFRSDHNVSQYLPKLWQIYSGKFTPKSFNSFGKCITLSDDVDLNIIKSGSLDMICLNDGIVNEPEKLQNRLIEVFDSILSEKSSFEK